jgi:acyl carrier protein
MPAAMDVSEEPEMDTEAKIKEILLENLDVSEEEIRPGASIMDDLGASSVDLVEIVAGLENEFDLEISDEDWSEMRTVQAVIDYVKKHTS